MTLHVYRMDRDGAVTEDFGTVNVRGKKAPLPIRDAYPPCACPHHRAAQAASR
jgi:queuine/archaeosine tRNA-ribosyltransferase